MRPIKAVMQDIVDDSVLDAEMDRRLERALWIVGAISGAVVLMTLFLQGPSWAVALLSVVFGGLLSEIVSCRRRRHRALRRAARFRKLLLVLKRA